MSLLIMKVHQWEYSKMELSSRRLKENAIVITFFISKKDSSTDIFVK